MDKVGIKDIVTDLEDIAFWTVDVDLDKVAKKLINGDVVVVADPGDGAVVIDEDDVNGDLEEMATRLDAESWEDLDSDDRVDPFALSLDSECNIVRSQWDFY